MHNKLSLWADTYARAWVELANGEADIHGVLDDCYTWCTSRLNEDPKKVAEERWNAERAERTETRS